MPERPGRYSLRSKVDNDNEGESRSGGDLELQANFKLQAAMLQVTLTAPDLSELHVWPDARNGCADKERTRMLFQYYLHR